MLDDELPAGLCKVNASLLFFSPYHYRFTTTLYEGKTKVYSVWIQNKTL
jgi:hypothetical protein